jgi:hypothetical protein
MIAQFCIFLGEHILCTRDTISAQPLQHQREYSAIQSQSSIRLAASHRSDSIHDSAILSSLHNAEACMHTSTVSFICCCLQHRQSCLVHCNSICLCREVPSQRSVDWPTFPLIFDWCDYWRSIGWSNQRCHYESSSKACPWPTRSGIQTLGILSRICLCYW